MKSVKFRRTAIAVAVCSTFASQLSPASTPIGGEFLVNQTLGSSQFFSAVARAADGRFVVVWRDDNGDGSGPRIAGRVYDERGIPAGNEFTVNATTASNQINPDVAMDADGDFVVVWQGYPDVPTTYGTGYGIFAQRFDASGSPAGSEIQVNNITANAQLRPAVAMDADGDFVVAWSSYLQTGDASGYGIFARRFNAAGVAQAGGFRANVTVTGNQDNADVATDATGNFVIVWESDDTSGSGVFARRYDAAGTALTSEFRVNNETAGTQRSPSVARDADGDFVVVWQDNRGEGAYGAGGYGIFARRYNNAGTQQGVEAVVNTFTASTQTSPQVAMDADGDYVVAWQSYGNENFPNYGTNYGIAARRFSAAGVGQGNEVQVNVFEAERQARPAVAIDADGDFVVAWDSYRQTQVDVGFNSGYDIYARRYNGPQAVDLALVNDSAPAVVAPGRSIAYSFRARNTNAATTPTGIPAIDAAIGEATGVFIFDTLPASAEFLSASGSNWTCTQAGGDVTCDYELPLAPGVNTPLLTVRAYSPEAAADSTLTNHVELSGDQADGDTSDNSLDQVTQVDCDAGTISFVTNSFSVDENAGTASVLVSRTGGCGAASVQFGTSNNSATAPADYTDSDTTLNWANGESGVKTVNVPVVNDGIDELFERVNLTLTGATGAPLGAITISRFVIIDDEVPVVELSTATQSVSEGVGLVTVTATSTILSSSNLVLKLRRSGTADKFDFLSTPTAITIPAGSTSGSASFTITDDARYEAPSETVILTASGLTSLATLGATTSQEITIADNDPLPSLSLAPASHATAEGGFRNVAFQLDRTSNETITVNFAIGGTATANVDYVFGAESPVVFEPGQTQRVVKVTTIDDTVTEPAETIAVTITVPTNAQAGTNTAYTYTISASD